MTNSLLRPLFVSPDGGRINRTSLYTHKRIWFFYHVFVSEFLPMCVGIFTILVNSHKSVVLCIEKNKLIMSMSMKCNISFLIPKDEYKYFSTLPIRI